MGKKGSWFSAIKRVFSHNSKDKPTDGSDKKSSKEKRKGKGILRHAETKSFIPLFREPSSIEKILGEADQLLIRPHTSSSEQPKQPPPLLVRPTSPRVASPKARASSPKVASPPRAVSPRGVRSPRPTSPKPAPPRPLSPKAAHPPRPVSPKASAPPGPVLPKAAPPRPISSKAASTSGAASSKAAAAPKVTSQSPKEISYVQRPEPTLQSQNLSATKIQAAYRGYMARRSFRALRGLVRLQEVVRGQNAKRQTVNAMKQMQLLVRVQTQIQSRRIQMLENQAIHPQPYRNNDKDVESTLSKWTLNQMSEAGEDWDDSLLTKEEEEARLRKKVEAVIKRERAMAYAYSHQLWKANPKSTQGPMDIRSNGYPWWWNWLERQLHPTGTSYQSQAATKNMPPSTPPKPVSEYKASPRLHASNYKFDNHESLTPRSSRSAIPLRAKQFQTTPRTTISKPRASAANSVYDAPLRDDDSLVSCPPFSVPNYMNPTVSAKAKLRANSNPKERLFPGGTPDSKRRFSFPLTPNIGSLKWNNKGSANKDSVSSQMVLEKNGTPRSVDSTVSMPAFVGRKPFNRFV